MDFNGKKVIDVDYERIIKANETIEIRDDNLLFEGHILSGGKTPIFDSYAKNIVFRDMIFRDFHLEYGALIYNESSMRFENCRFLLNHFEDEDGIILNRGQLEVINCLFEDNRLEVGNGSCICNEGSVLIKNSRFINNKSEFGGAIYNKSELDIADSIFKGNTSEFEGGAIYNKSKLKISNSVFAKNMAAKGGAIFNEDFILIRDSNFEGNLAGDSNHIENYKNANADISGTDFKDE